MKYEFKMLLHHRYYIEEEITVFVEGYEGEESAEHEAHKLACRYRVPSSWDANHSDTDIDHAELISAEPEEGEEMPIIRCDETLDMKL